MNTDRPGKRILLVDDEERILEVLSRRLQSWGYEVLTGKTGEEGLQIAETAQPDLILLDIVMPTMRGREVCARLKEDSRTKRIPVIFLTALGMPEQVEAGIHLGAEDYIVKPFNPQEMKQRIEACLSRPDHDDRQVVSVR